MVVENPYALLAVLEEMRNGAIAANDSGFLMLVMVNITEVDAAMTDAGRTILSVLTLRVQVIFAVEGAVIEHVVNADEGIAVEGNVTKMIELA